MDLYKVYINHDFEVTVTCFKAISTYCRLSRHFIGGGSCGGVCVGGGGMKCHFIGRNEQMERRLCVSSRSNVDSWLCISTWIQVYS